MRKISISVWHIAVVFLCVFAVSLPLLATAETSRTRPDNAQERLDARLAVSLPLLATAETSRTRPDNAQERLDARLNVLIGQLCERVTAAADRGLLISVPDFCIPTPPPPPPPPVDVCPNVPGDQAAGPCADAQCIADGGTWDGDSCDMPPPPPVDECPNVPGVQESGPCADAQCVENGGSWDGESCDMPDPEEIIGHVVISEVHYDVDAEHGVNSGNNNNEWVELYNGSTETVDLSGWKLTDNNADDTLPEGTLLPAEAFLIITATSSTAALWDMPDGAIVIVLGNQIGNALATAGDVVFLQNAEDTTIDAVSWGTNIDAFTPSVAVVAKGHSMARTSLTVDTDSAADWEDRSIPSPGLADVPLAL